MKGLLGDLLEGRSYLRDYSEGCFGVVEGFT